MFCKKGAFNILISFRPGTFQPCEFCKIFKNTVFSRTPPMAASVINCFRFLWIIDEYLTQTHSCFLFNIISQSYFMSLKDIELYSSVQEKKYDDVVLCYWKNLKLFNVLSKALP